MTMISSIPARRVRYASFAGTSLAALVLALAAPTAVRAQSFAGTGTITQGSATITTSSGRTDIAVNSGQVLIDWTTSAPASGTTIFQPAGTTATFASSGFSAVPGDYVVLNRVTPVDALGAPTNAMIQFNGTVNSTLAGLPGGKIWFYSPNGIIVGPTASFNVGGLVLTTNPIDVTGGFFGSKGEIRFRGATGSTGLIQIQPGASIKASPNPQLTGDQAYIAMVAPRIEQGGTVNADGPIGYIAAEDADITINAGLFDIFVNAGTTDSNGIVHTGTTTGAASAGTADPRTIYMVAVPKNDGLTMLLNGNIGYAPAASASNDGAAVILSAGHGLNFDSGNPLSNPANIAIGDATFSNVTTATASDSIFIAPTTLTTFDRFATLDAFKTVSLTASNGAQIIANDTAGLPADIPFPPSGSGYSLDVLSGFGNTGGAISLTTSSGGATSAAGRIRLRANGDGASTASSGIDGNGGSIAVNALGGSFSASDLEISATGSGGFAFGSGGNGQGGTVTILSQAAFNVGTLTIDAGGTGIGGDGSGGSGAGGVVNLTANGGSITAQSIGLSASGTGGSGISSGGNGQGGTISVLVAGNGTIAAPGGFAAQASGFGGNGSSSGGNALGGHVSLASTSGLLDFDAVNLDAAAFGGASNGPGGNATGGTVLISLTGASQDWTDLTADASTVAGATFGTGVAAGSATGDLASGVQLNIQGGTLNLSGGATLANNATGQVGDGPGTFASAGSAKVSVSGGGAINTATGLIVTSDADFNLDGLSASPNYTPKMTGGVASVLLDGGSISTPLLDVRADANGLGALLGAGSAAGGTAQVVVQGGGTLTVTTGVLARRPEALTISASADGNYSTDIGSVFGTVGDGFASAASGGTALLQLDSGIVSVTGTAFIRAAGFAGPSATIGGANSIGNGTGGTARVALNGGTITLDSGLTIDATGDGGTISGGARGGLGQGGTAAIDATGGTLSVNNLGLVLLADGTSEPVSGSTSGTAGDATGGIARLTSQGIAIVNIPISIQVSARGMSGSGSGPTGAGGIATGGIATVLAQGGTMALGPAQISADAVFGSGLAAQTGANRAGIAQMEAAGGAIGVTGDLSITANTFLSADLLDLHGADAIGGQASLLADNAGSISVTGATALNANGLGGFNTLAGQVGGNGTGGASVMEALTGGAVTLSGDVTLNANGAGGSATGVGGLGGAGFGGSAMVSQTGGGSIHLIGNLTVDSNANGGGNAIVSFTGGKASGGTSTLTSEAGTLRIDGNATLISSPTGGANPDGSTAPTVAGLIVLGTGTASPGGVTAVGGSLSATAIGDDARADGMGLTATIDGALVTVNGDALLHTMGDMKISALNGGGLTTAGTLTVTSDAGAIISTGLLASGGASTFQAPGSVSLGTLQSGGPTSLISAGAVDVSDLLSAGAVTVSGGSVDILSSGGLSFASADATNGDLTIDVAGNLVLGTVGTIGGATLRSRSASVTANGSLTATSFIDLLAGGAITTNGAIDPAVLRMTAGTSITANATAVGGAITLTAGTDLNLNAAITATTTLDMTAGRAIDINALASGAQITATSADIALGKGGQLGKAGTTQIVQLTSSVSANPSFVGGLGGVGGYSLDAGELQRIFADNVIRFSASGTAPAPITVGNLALTFGPNGNIGTGGTFALSSAGAITVTGPLALTTSNNADTLQINASRLDLVTDSGSIALLNTAGAPQGQLGVTARSFAVATANTLALLAPGGNILVNTALMDAPGPIPKPGVVIAGSIAANVIDGIYIQNTGATTAYTDRRGFTAGALAIGTASDATQIVVNGVTIDATGNAVAGLDTVGTITINGSVPSGSGRFNGLSSVNGCIISLRCGFTGDRPLPAKPDLSGPPDPPGTGSNAAFINDAILQVDVQKSSPATLLPLVDEPVTGVGNEDLWGDRCASSQETCEGGK
ncbi:hypothetical protein [Novosphingobium sp.]|uniref:hypothetical protein n=1 Tax=Novosphingobium sp. TaxID=1874826 RepID=UPI002FDA0A5A